LLAARRAARLRVGHCLDATGQTESFDFGVAQEADEPARRPTAERWLRVSNRERQRTAWELIVLCPGTARVARAVLCFKSVAFASQLLQLTDDEPTVAALPWSSRPGGQAVSRGSGWLRHDGDTDAALRSHAATRYRVLAGPSGQPEYVMGSAPTFEPPVWEEDWSILPRPYKVYPRLPPLALRGDLTRTSMPALEALARSGVDADSNAPLPDRAALAWRACRTAC
jgi:hypothetical protein